MLGVHLGICAVPHTASPTIATQPQAVLEAVAAAHLGEAGGAGVGGAEAADGLGPEVDML